MRTVVIVNPNAGHGRAGRTWPALHAAIERAVPGAENRLTSGPGHATTLVREALRAGAERVIAIGGDGTNNEVVNGFFDERGAPIAPEAALCLVPSGTGGDFRRVLTLPDDPLEALARVLDAPVRPIDVGRIAHVDHDGVERAQMFVNIASFGMSGLVDRIVNAASKRLGGRVSFFVASLRAMMRYRNQRVRLVIDHGRVEMELPIFNVAVCNGRYFGGGMHVAPAARIDDGRLEVVVLGDLSLGGKLALSSRIYKGTHVDMPGVIVESGTHVRAESADEVLLDVDGETPGRLPATFEILPGALRLQG